MKRYWISQFKCWGFVLNNQTDGGLGMLGGGNLKFKKVSAYNLDGSFFKTFESLLSCASELNSTLANVCRAKDDKYCTILRKYQIRIIYIIVIQCRSAMNVFTNIYFI